jgi:hypothetical protein
MPGLIHESAFPKSLGSVGDLNPMAIFLGGFPCDFTPET